MSAYIAYAYSKKVLKMLTISIPRIDYCSVVCNNHLYVMGGREKDNRKYTAKLMRYDPAEDKWIQLSNMKRSKAYFTATVVDRRIVITGAMRVYTSYSYQQLFL